MDNLSTVKPRKEKFRRTCFNPLVWFEDGWDHGETNVLGSCLADC